MASEHLLVPVSMGKSSAPYDAFDAFRTRLEHIHPSSDVAVEPSARSECDSTLRHTSENAEQPDFGVDFSASLSKLASRGRNRTLNALHGSRQDTTPHLCSLVRTDIDIDVVTSASSTSELRSHINGHLQQTYAELDAAFTPLLGSSRKRLKQTEHLGGLLQHPLGVTICSSNALTRALVDDHCSNTHRSTQGHYNAMKQLDVESDQLVQDDPKITQVPMIAETDDERGKECQSHSQSLRTDMAGILAASQRQICEIDDTFKEQIQFETVKMLNNMITS